MKKTIFITIAITLYCSSSIAQYNYPATKTVDSADTYFGVTYKDPYRWLENLKDSNVVNWFKEQKEFADKKISKSFKVQPAFYSMWTGGRGNS